MTKAAFLAAYEFQLMARYTWARDTAKLTRFLAAAAETISTTRSNWNHDGEAVTAAWRAIGGKGRPTLKALRGLN